MLFNNIEYKIANNVPHFSFWYQHIQFGFEIKLVLCKSSFNELHLFLILVRLFLDLYFVCYVNNNFEASETVGGIKSDKYSGARLS
jgi:hypothetical protein